MTPSSPSAAHDPPMQSTSASQIQPALSQQARSISLEDASSSSDDSSDDTPHALDLTEDNEWEDTTPDTETLEVVSLFDDATFPDLESMLRHCKEAWDFDVRGVVRNCELDFYGCVKLVNYIRYEVRKGNRKPSVESSSAFEDDGYLQPVLEDDAVLFCLDELLEPEQGGELPTETNGAPRTQNKDEDAATRVLVLEEQLRTLQSQFSEYRLAVEKTLEERWSDRGAGRDATAASTSANGPSAVSSEQKSARDDDTHYFDSYSYNDIHETMLKDTVRTSAYRDFIYNHKNLFASRTVLDIGCGTGILSLFSAKAGASKVLAVDNSNIITKAREIVAEHGLLDIITPIRGKIEEVSLPLPTTSQSQNDASNGKADILVSEWMGYALLYEAMLDSVLHARDAYLSPSGLMVPSNCTLHIAPLNDPDYLASTIGFWPEVYGFDMSVMTTAIFDDVIVRSPPRDAVPAKSAMFKSLDLYTVTTKELEFEEPFEVVLDSDVESLDGWVIWFDTFFLPGGRTAELPSGARAEEWPGANREDLGTAFTTGPGGEETHWKAGCLMIDRRKSGKGVNDDGGKKKGKRRMQPTPLKKGQRISGTVSYKKSAENSRELDIEVGWEAVGVEERGRQMWCLR